MASSATSFARLAALFTPADSPKCESLLFNVCLYLASVCPSFCDGGRAAVRDSEKRKVRLKPRAFRKLS
jgi:hypothetical protein